MIDEQLTSTTGLEPEEWNYATWRWVPVEAGQRYNVVRPEKQAPAFDAEACGKRLARVDTDEHGVSVEWHRAEIRWPMSRQEASFWLAAIERAWDDFYERTPRQVADDLIASSDFDFDFDPTRWETALESMSVVSADNLITERMMILSSLLPPEEIFKRMLKLRSTRSWATTSEDWRFRLLAAGAAPYLVPLLDDAQLDDARGKLAPQLAQAEWPSHLFHLGAALGLHEEARRVLAELPDDHYAPGSPSGGRRPASWADEPFGVLFGLGDPELVRRERERLGLRLSRPWHVVGWLAHFELSDLEPVREAILALADKKKRLEPLIAVLTRGDAPELAALLAEAMVRTRAPARARAWLLSHPRAVVLGLTPRLGRGGQLGEATENLLRGVASRHRDAVEACLDELEPADAERLRRILEPVAGAGDPDAELPPGLARAFAELPKSWGRKRPPKWLDPGDLPPVTAGDAALDAGQVKLLLVALRESNLKKPHPLVPAVARAAEPDQLDAFATGLHQLWAQAGWPGRDRWALEATGHLGGECAVLELAPKLEKWRAQVLYQRTKQGVHTLRKLAARGGPGADLAVMHFDRILRATKKPSLRNQCDQAISQIAQARGMTRAELEDYAVPTLGLDEHGRRIVDFGPRQFHFVLGADAKPKVREFKDGLSKGKLKANPPKPGKRDDPELAPRARADWMLFKKQLQQVLNIQIGRLEQAMVLGRRWNVERFTTLLKDHPLMGHLVRRLLWGVYDGAELRKAFRVSDEGETLDADDELLTLDPDLRIGVVHPLELSGAEREQWAELFGDYEIVPPFALFDRPLFTLDEAELDSLRLTRFCGVDLPSETLMFGLEKLGWHREGLGDGLWVHQLAKPFYSYDLTAIVHGSMDASVIVYGHASGTPGSIEYCELVRGIFHTMGSDEGWQWKDPPKSIRLGDAPPVVVSEVLADLEVMYNKAIDCS